VGKRTCDDRHAASIVEQGVCEVQFLGMRQD